MTQVIRSPQDIRKLRVTQSQKGSTVGFVPTMGALHSGHLELIKRAKQENDLVFCSVFVNPAQFNDPKDLEKYPRTFERDLSLLDSVGTDFLFFPDYTDLYPDGYKYRVTENELSKRFCGAHRPGHFDGVLSVVLKLFGIIAPDRAYFGEKDYQQLVLIKGMVEAFFLPVEIVSVPTVRETDGLAMSSRNVRLSPADRKLAPQLYQILESAKTDQEAARELERLGFKVDYVETHEGRRLAAAFLGEVRLIDNVSL